MAGSRNPKVLVMQNNKECALSLVNHLSRQGVEAVQCCCDRHGLEILKNGRFPVVITEACAQKPGREISDPIKAVREICPHAAILATTDNGVIPGRAGSALSGVYDFIVSNSSSRPLEAVINGALTRQALAGRVRLFRGAALGLGFSAPAWFALGLFLASIT